MKKIILILFGLFILSGCAGPPVHPTKGEAEGKRTIKLPATHPSGAVEKDGKWVVDKRDCDILTAPVKEYGVAHCMYMKGWREQRK